MSKTLWILCGIPGSGKSHWVKEYANNEPIISRDEIRFELLDDNEDYFAHETLVWDIYVRHIRTAIEQSDNVFADATHLNEKSRNKLLDALKLHSNVKINCVYFDVPITTCLTRNKQRQGRAFVPSSVIRRMSYQIIKPAFNEKHKYNCIYTVNEKGEIINSETNPFMEVVT